MPPPEKNLSPYLTSAAVAAVAVAAILLVGWLSGGSPDALGRLAAIGVIGGVLLGAWAGQTDGVWTLRGFVWRYAVCSTAVAVLSAVCGPSPK